MNVLFTPTALPPQPLAVGTWGGGRESERGTSNGQLNTLIEGATYDQGSKPWLNPVQFERHVHAQQQQEQPALPFSSAGCSTGLSCSSTSSSLMMPLSGCVQPSTRKVSSTLSPAMIMAGRPAHAVNAMPSCCRCKPMLIAGCSNFSVFHLAASPAPL